MHLVRLSAPLAAIALVCFLSAPATAQAEASAALTVTAPAGPHTVALGGNTSVQVTVQLTLEGIVCTGPSTATVNLQLVDANPMTGIAFTMPTSVSFPINGPQAYSQLGPYTSPSQMVMLNATVAASVLANHEHSVTVNGTFSQSGLGAGCSASPFPGGSLDASSGAPVTIMTGPSMNGPGGTTDPMTTTETAVALPLAIQVILLVALAMLAVRRR